MKYTLREYHQMVVEKLGPDVRARISAGDLVDLLDELEQLRKFRANEPLLPQIGAVRDSRISIINSTADFQ